ncbi:MAG: zinc protease [Myxococcota bacterium]|jgi:zinc protease
MWPALLLAPTLHLPVQRHTLDNGMVVILLVDARAPLIATELTFSVGAAEDGIAVPGFSGGSGMAHLVEHLMFEGEYDALLAEAGGESNAWTSHDWTTYTAAAPSDALERLLYLESRRMADPLAGVSDDDLENQIAVVLTERSMDRNGGRGGRALTESIYATGHPFHTPVLGDPDVVGDIDRASVTGFLSAWYQPDGAILVIGGDIDPEATLARVEHWFGGLPAREKPDRAVAPAVAQPTHPRRVLYESTMPTVTMAWPTIPMGHPDEAALDLLAEILSERLGDRVTSGRLDVVGAWTDNGRLGGRLVLSASHLRRSSRALHRELDRALSDTTTRPISPDLLRHHQERWRMWFVRSAQSLETRVRMAAGCVRGGEAPDCMEASIAAREAVTPEQLLDVARRYLLDETQVTLEVHAEDRRSLSSAVEVDPL